tara:strand:+ start:178 stop:624 length:447 start_codon:yes stop_codon:yes gene_type:complete
MPNSKNINNGAFGMAMLIIVTIIIIILVVWAVQKKNKAQKDSEHVVWPPDDYMKNIGSKCPDYWVPVNEDRNTVTCQNKFNITVANNQMGEDQCYQDITGYPNSRKFKKLNKFPLQSSDLKDRCKWIKNCGIKPNVNASWLGIEDKCI